MKDTYQQAIALYEASVKAGMPADICQLCGACVSEGVKGCFELFSELCLYGYTDLQYRSALSYGVDAHALQHPEIHGRKNNAAHLLRLHWMFERGGHAEGTVNPIWWQAYLQHSDVPILEPPPERGTITVVDVAPAQTPQTYAVLMERWATDVYRAWSLHHEWAREELARLIPQR